MSRAAYCDVSKPVARYSAGPSKALRFALVLAYAVARRRRLGRTPMVAVDRA
jgi:hypothetical protein